MAEEQEVEDAPEQDSPAEQTSDVEEEEAEVEDTEEEDTGEESEGEEDEEPQAAVGRSPALQKLLDKYGGDEDALVNAYFEQANSSSRIHKELEELKEYLLKEREEKEDPEAAVAEDPTVRRLASRYENLGQRAQKLQQQQMQLIGEYGQAEQEVKVLEAQMDKAEFEEKAVLRREINDRKRDMRDLKDKVTNQIADRSADIQQQMEDIQERMEEAKQKVLSAKEQERKNKLRSAKVARMARDDFNAELRVQANRFGIDPASNQYKILNNSLKTQIATELSQMPPDAPAIDVRKAVQDLMGEFAKAMGMKPKFSKVSQHKNKATTQVRPPKGDEPVLPEGVKEPKLPKGIKKYDRDGNWTLEYVRAREKALLSTVR